MKRYPRSKLTVWSGLALVIAYLLSSVVHIRPVAADDSDASACRGWRVDREVRLMADINGDGRADIVAFGDAGVWTALSNGDGTFAPPGLVLGDFGSNQGWDPSKHVRLMADINGDGKADIVAFGDAGV